MNLEEMGAIDRLDDDALHHLITIVLIFLQVDHLT